jgi:DnaJ-class molecular chaperone
VKAVFGKKSLYEILEVDRTATPAAIKKAYFRLALKFVRQSAAHPLRCVP